MRRSNAVDASRPAVAMWMSRTLRSVVMLVMVSLASCSSGESSDSVERVCPETDVADRTEISEERAELLLGFSEADAERCAATLGWAYRVGMRDGESFALTMDYSPQRVTVSIEEGVVTAIVVG